MRTTSFQGSTYKHNHQATVHGTSGLKIMDGEDLTYGDRKRIQQLQSEAWWKQQMDQKQRLKNRNKLEKELFDQQTKQITEHRHQLQQQKAKRLRDMEIAYKQTNMQQLNEKLTSDKLNRDLEDKQKQQHINYLLNHDLFTQNPDTCQSMLGPNRVKPYHWKGMNQQQRKRILDLQEQQRNQKQRQKQIQKQQDRLFAQQMQAQRKAIVLQDRAKNKGLKNVRKGMDEYNRLKAEQMKKKAYQAYDFTQTYKNE